ncbi:hypothetical protein ACFYNM_30065 [Streptomyces spororaveus]|uniref:hypothetical protein n=1 Tax=Streptomyces spororaveus TaxID=284039 RepID=UPI0036BB1363
MPSQEELARDALLEGEPQLPALVEWARLRQGAGDPELRVIVAEGLNIYFKHGETRADHLEVEFTDIDYTDASF